MIKGVSMDLNVKSKVLDKEGIKRTLLRIAHEILEKNGGTKDLAVVGIKYRGAYLAERIANNLKEIEGAEVPMGALDITLYRDDLTEIGQQPVVHATEIDFDITGKKIILVDDVLFSGRTVRCALDELIDFGRPANIQLAVLVDRGHRELPIRPDFVGKNVPTAKKDSVEVRLEETDGKEEVVVLEEKKK
jgi:pyrimidine operon attenuation protein/uracil phosphoribosyltransferase